MTKKGAGCHWCCTTDQQLDHVSDVASVKEVWIMVLITFERNNLLNIQATRRKFCNGTMQSVEKMSPYVNHLKALVGSQNL